jgi:16S rRNA G527 N7-methylase RsmG
VRAAQTLEISLLVKKRIEKPTKKTQIASIRASTQSQKCKNWLFRLSRRPKLISPLEKTALPG